MEALPIAILCTHFAPKGQVGLSPYEMLYGRPFVFFNDLFLDPEAQTLWFYTIVIGQFQQDIHLWGVNSVQFSRSVMSDSLWRYEPQHARPPYPPPTPRVHSDSCPSSLAQKQFAELNTSHVQFIYFYLYCFSINYIFFNLLSCLFLTFILLRYSWFKMC